MKTPLRPRVRIRFLPAKVLRSRGRHLDIGCHGFYSATIPTQDDDTLHLLHDRAMFSRKEERDLDIILITSSEGLKLLSCLIRVLNQRTSIRRAKSVARFETAAVR